MTPEDIPRLFAEHWNAGDADALAGLFAEDADFVNVVGLWWRRRKDIRKAHAYALERYFRDTEISLKRLEVKYIRPDVATVHVRWTMHGQRGLNDETTGDRAGMMIFVVERRETAWVAVAAQNTDISPGMETNLAGQGGLEPVSYQASAGTKED